MHDEYDGFSPLGGYGKLITDGYGGGSPAEGFGGG